MLEIMSAANGRNARNSSALPSLGRGRVAAAATPPCNARDYTARPNWKKIFFRTLNLDYMTCFRVGCNHGN